MKKLFLIVSLLYISIFNLRCSSQPVNADLEQVFKKIPDDEYKKIMNQYTLNDKKYSGFYNEYDVSITMIGTVVTEALLQREGYFLQWSSGKAQSEREKALQKLSSTSEFFISMFTPTVAHNDLNKGNSMWKVVLEVNGQRYEAEISKFDKNLVQTQNLFPHYTRFSKGYVARFNVPMTSIESGKCVIILTSSLGSSTFRF
ncbi:MAG: hypothetical protein KDD58_01235 [Bdellovibrionales bacterium]|nr:hypothetical protein [Bdellovibrionales bacterium]